MNLSSPARVVIVEDQPPIRRDVELLVRQQPGFTVIGTCGSVQEAIVLIQSQKPDIVLLDVNLGDGTGFDILESLYDLSFQVIFLTAHTEHAIKAIKADATDYLLKPVDPEELKAALAKALRTAPLSMEDIKSAFEALKKTEDQEKIVLRLIDSIQIVQLTEVMYCDGIGGYTTFVLTGGKKIVTSKHLKEFEDKFPIKQFLRPHQSYIVNVHYIDAYLRDGNLLLKDGTQIPVSFRRKDIINDYFNNLK